jgi:adenylate cyclase
MNFIKVTVSFFLIISFFELICLCKAESISDASKILKSKNDTINLINKLNQESTSLLGKKPDSARFYSDSALKLSKSVHDDYSVAVSMVNLSFSLRGKNDSTSKANYILNAIKLFKTKNDKWGEAYINKKIGDNYRKINNYEQALNYYYSALAIYQELNDNKHVAFILFEIGEQYMSISQFPKAINVLFQSLQISEKNNDSSRMADALTNIGYVYIQQNDIDKAKKYLNDAMSINQNLGRKIQYAKCLINLGVYYYNKGNIHDAFNYYMEALKVYKQSGEIVPYEMYINIGEFYLNMKDYDASKKYYFKALEQAEDENSDEGRVLSYYFIGSFYNETSNLKQAEDNFLVCKKRAEEINSLYWLRLADSSLASLSKKRNDYKSAFNYYVQYTAINDSLFSQEKTINILEIGMKYDQDKKDAATQAAAQQEKMKNKIIMISLIMGCGLLLVLAFVIYMNYRNKKRANKELSTKNKIISETNIQLKTLNNKVSNQNTELSKLNKNLSQKNYLISVEQKKSDELLLNILPDTIAGRLKAGEPTIADHFDEASVIFIDQVDFTRKSSGATPERVVKVLNGIYSEFDKIAEKYNLEKIKTMGDCYMAASGVPVPNKNHAEAAAKFALELMEKMDGYVTEEGTVLHFRTGIDCGPVVAGIIGERKFIYDLWGDTVNTASRMEEYSVPGKIQVTERFKKSLVVSRESPDGSQFIFEERGEIEIKGKGKMRTWFLKSHD